jgi:hypothetical protein
MESSAHRYDDEVIGRVVDLVRMTFVVLLIEIR